MDSKNIKVPPHIELVVTYNYGKASGGEIILEHYDGGPLLGNHVIANFEVHYNAFPTSEDQSAHWATIVWIPDEYSKFLSEEDCKKIMQALKQHALIQEPALLQTKRYCSYDPNNPGYVVQAGQLYPGDQKLSN